MFIYKILKREQKGYSNKLFRDWTTINQDVYNWDDSNYSLDETIDKAVQDNNLDAYGERVYDGQDVGVWTFTDFVDGTIYIVIAEQQPSDDLI